MFYDGPSAGLDPISSAQIDELIVGLSKQLEVTSVVVTYEMNSAFRVADCMAMFDKGRMRLVESRQCVEAIRDSRKSLDSDAALIRQYFSRGRRGGHH